MVHARWIMYLGWNQTIRGSRHEVAIDLSIPMTSDLILSECNCIYLLPQIDTGHPCAKILIAIQNWSIVNQLGSRVLHLILKNYGNSPGENYSVIYFGFLQVMSRKLRLGV